MRKILSFCAALLLAGASLFGQGGLTMYNMPYIPQASYLNPANTPHCNFYLSLPVLSGVGAGMNNDFFSLRDVNIDFNARWDKEYGDSLLASFADVAQISNRLGLRGEVDLFGLGIRSGKHYISFYIREAIQADLSFPDELFRFLRDYERGTVYGNTLKMPYIMSGGRINVTQYRPFTLQYAYDVLPNFTLGGKVSYISGILTADATMDTLFTQIKPEDPNDWEVVGRINVRTGGYSNADTANFGNVFINPQNSGFSFGLGGKLTALDERLDISFSAINFGRIFWTEKVGLTSFTEESFENAEGLGEVFDTLFRVEERAGVDFTQALNPEFFLQANYFLNKSLSAGALIRGQAVFKSLNSAFGLFFNARPSKWFGFTTGYIYSNRAHSVPVGLTLQPGPFQLYVVSDNVLGFALPASARQFHLQAGLNLTFGKTMRPWTEKEPDPDDLQPYPDVYLPEEEEEAADPEADPFMPPPVAGERDTIISPAPEPLYKEDEPDITTYLVTNPVFLYRGPSAGTTVLDTIAPNTVITVLQKKIPDWWYVEYGNQSGWIQPRNIRPSLELPVSEQAEDEVPAENIVTFTPLDYILLDQTAIRESASESARDIHQLKKWDEVLVLEKTNSIWWKVRHEGHEGYVKSAMLNPRPENYVRPEEGPAKPPAPAPKQTQPEKDLGVFVLLESTSLRMEPTHESTALMRLRQGMKVRLLEKTTAYWWKVEIKGVTGYCKAVNLSPQ